MKIAFFTDTYYPQVNGVAYSIKLFSEYLRKNGNKVHIFCPEGAEKSKYIHTIPSLKFRSYPEYNIGLPLFRTIKEIEEINPDIIHIHSPFSIGNLGLSIAKIMNIPTVGTFHTLISEYFYYAGTTFKKEIADNYAKMFFDRTSVITVPSNSIRDLLKDFKVKKPIEVLATPSKFITKRKNKKKNKDPIILHVGRLCKEKRVDFVLRAFKILSKKMRAKLIITSDGPDKKRLKDLCKKLKIKNVKFTGYVSDEELQKLYSKADLFVSASDTETQGMILLEAWSCGCPVVVRNAFGFKDYVTDGKNGLLFDTENDMVEKITNLLNSNSLRKKIIANGYKSVEKFDMLKNGRKIEEIYKEAIKINKESRTPSKLLYAAYLITSFIEFWFIKKMKISFNSRFLTLHITFFKLASVFDRFRS